MQVLNDLIPWGEHEVERRAQEAEAKARERGFEKGLAEARAERLAEMEAEALQKALSLLRRSLAHWARDRFGERTARLLSAEIELLEDPAAFDRIWGWLETCESGDSLLALVQSG